MRHALSIPFALLLTLALTLACGRSDDSAARPQAAPGYDDRLVVMGQVNGPGTNSYLIYSPSSKEAAVIDIGGHIDEIESVIAEKELNLKYILFTHGHFDHVMGYPDFAARHPGAKVAMHREDYDDMFTQRDWVLANMAPEFVERLKSDPMGAAMLDFEPDAIGRPDLWLQGGETFSLGGNVIRTVHTPGHSPGSMCFQVNDRVFSGDLLFDGSVGRTDLQNSSFEDLVTSVRGLYQNLPNETIVHPGHGPSTTIGEEKAGNAVVQMDTMYVNRAR